MGLRQEFSRENEISISRDKTKKLVTEREGREISVEMREEEIDSP
jgi:hypothetical protein